MSRNEDKKEKDHDEKAGWSSFHRMARIGKLVVYVLKNFNLRNIHKTFAYMRRHGYKALRGKLLYKFSHRQSNSGPAILKTEIAWNFTQTLLCLDTPLTGRFRFPVSGMSSMEFQTVTDDHVSGRLRLRILDSAGSLMREVIIPGNHVMDGDYTTFAFDPIPCYAGQCFQFSIEGLEKPWPSLFYSREATLRDISLEKDGSINCRIFASEWKGEAYDLWAAKNEPAGSELEVQKADTYPIMPTISLLVPLFNTPGLVFSDMMESVLSQTYGKWELCLAYGGGASEELLKKAKRYAATDKRIRVAVLGKNLGISGNTNAAADLATGDFVGFLDHDDTLAPFALHDMVEALNRDPESDFFYSDEDQINEDGRKRFDAHFKPDFAPDTLRSHNYIRHFTIMKKSLFEQVGRFRKEYDGSQDYDLFLRASEKAFHIVHIPRILYHCRVSPNSAAGSLDAKPDVAEASIKALSSHLERIGLPGKVAVGLLPTVFDVRPAIMGEPFVSIIIPNRNHFGDLKTCIDSVLEKTEWTTYEILVVENGSQKSDIFHYYQQLQLNPKIRVLIWKEDFNFSSIMNFAVKEAKGDYILFLNNDTEVIDGQWLTRMLEPAQRDDVGAVGAMLYFPDDTIQHAGVIIGLNTLADHAFRNFDRGLVGSFSRTHIVQNVSAVTAACMLMKKKVFDAVGGMDESFAVAFNDVDLCMKIREKQYLIVWTPYAKLYHFESKSRGLEDTAEKLKRFESEIAMFHRRWGQPHQLKDPYYNPNLSLEGSGYDMPR